MGRSITQQFHQKPKNENVEDITYLYQKQHILQRRNALTYIPRQYQGKMLEGELLKALEEDNVIIFGFPGIGKSSTAKAVAAMWREKGRDLR